jgi:hypothetical protein
LDRLRAAGLERLGAAAPTARPPSNRGAAAACWDSGLIGARIGPALLGHLAASNGKAALGADRRSGDPPTAHARTRPALPGNQSRSAAEADARDRAGSPSSFDADVQQSTPAPSSAGKRPPAHRPDRLVDGALESDALFNEIVPGLLAHDAPAGSPPQPDLRAPFADVVGEADRLALATPPRAAADEPARIDSPFEALRRDETLGIDRGALAMAIGEILRDDARRHGIDV